MSFEPQKVEAQLALNRISTTDMPAIAWEALDAGMDGPAIRRLAALEFPTFFEVQRLLPSAMGEMNIAVLPKSKAAFRLAQLRAREILRTDADPFCQLRDFCILWRESDYCRELEEYGTLEDDVYVARCEGTPEAELRTWVLAQLNKLATVREEA
jgi:hypothetical protein